MNHPFLGTCQQIVMISGENNQLGKIIRFPYVMLGHVKCIRDALSSAHLLKYTEMKEKLN